MKKLIKRFQSLPLKKRHTISLIIILALLASLGLFIYAVLTQRLELRKRAGSVEPIPTQITLNYSFDNSVAVATSVWGWSGIVGSNVEVEGGELKATLAGGQLQTRNALSMFPRSNCQNINGRGDFQTSIDMLGANPEITGQGTTFQELTYGGDTGFGIRRSKNGSLEKLEAVRTNGSTLSTVIGSYDLPANTGAIRVRLQRMGATILFQYTLNRDVESYTTLATINIPQDIASDLPNEAQVYIRVAAEQPDYPTVVARFDRFTATLEAIYAGNPCGSASPTPTPSPNPKLTCTTDPECGCALDVDTNQCAIQNNTYLTGRCFAPDFCSGITGDCGPKCINNRCTLYCPGQPTPPSCPSLAPVYCPNGTIISGGYDQNGCPLPGICTPPSTPFYDPPRDVTMKFRVKFTGVDGANADGAKATIRFRRGNSADVVTPPVTFSHVGNGVYEAVVTTSISTGSGYTIYVKGEKHLAVKFCQDAGQTSRCSGVGNINIGAGTLTQVFDFSGLRLEPGDLPDQDGVANINDFNKIKDLLSKPCLSLTDAEKLTADLDYSGCINVRDAFLMRQTLQSRYDDD